ncbi:MAG: DnaJ domain-containing protein [bacterium]
MIEIILLVAALLTGIGAWRISWLSTIMGKIGMPMEASHRTQRRMQGWCFFALIILSLRLKIFPLSIILTLIAIAMTGIGLWRDRMLAGLREDPESGAKQRASASTPTGTMTRNEALQVLGLSSQASDEDIETAWRKLIAQIHPDKGGTDYLAAKINEAKAVLLNR